ncbi:protein trafficking Pga2 [Clohesyomyces aquaticus]|uniref:Protein trafficking Pga2 n=1 Tax=Clohesyomyces aquaticus TaxID=1231657 RepID=A0A1Y1ZRF0_9PLEO|nr:protein trafficking Pga2 [Clohesyomyces aquaticus]
MASNTNAQSIPDLLSTWAGNFSRNTTSAFAQLRLKDYVRLITIIGAYCLLRPYIIKLGGKLQAKAHEADSADHGDIHPNELRGGKIEIPGIEDSEDEEEDEEFESKPGDWGRNARVRQRKFIREALAREEERLRLEAAAEDDKDIEEFLVD